MAKVYQNVRLSTFTEDGSSTKDHDSPVRIEFAKEKGQAQISILNGGSALELIKVSKDVELARTGKKTVVVSTGSKSFSLGFGQESETTVFQTDLQEAISTKKDSVFTLRTDPASAEQYFQFYGYLSQQQNMMQDYIRTSTYQRAMLDNCADFQDKVVLDVGAGSGILSFFAIQAGAKKVYAIEASTMALHCQALVDNNNLKGRIVVVPGKVEEVNIPEQVDLIISEPMGYMLFNERMLETYLHAKKWLKPGGKMFPTQGDLHISPFTDESLYMEQFSKANFWYQQAFHGVDLSSLRQSAVQEYFKQPIVDTFDMRICMARSHKYTVDFQTADEKDLHNIEIPVSFTMLQSGTVHGLAFWFDVAFIGSQTVTWLSTSPTQPLTHWYQVRCLMQTPIFVKQGQTLTGKVLLKSNTRQSYDVEIELTVPGTNNRSSNVLDLKNPFFRYTGLTPQAPPGNNHQSPSDAYWNNTDPTASVQQLGVVTMLNGSGGVIADASGGATAAGMMVQQQQQQQLALPQQQQQQGVSLANLVPLANVAPINPGSIPAATVVTTAGQAHIQMRTSVGAGISPNAFTQTQAYSSTATANNIYPVSNQFMIGDYAIPGNMVLPTQGLNLPSGASKSG